MFRTSCSIIVLLAAISLGVIGCGGGGRQIEYAPVEALVLLDGQPVPGATVTLVPTTEGRSSATGETDASGRAKLMVLIPGQKVEGEYFVGVSKVITPKGPAPGEEPKLPEGGKPSPETKVEHVVPQRYNDPKRSGIKVNISPGQKEIRIELSS